GTAARSPPWSPGTGRWSWVFAGGCSKILTTPRTRSRPPSSFWPAAGKVAVMARRGPAGPELSFHLGGKALASYSVEDLGKLGVEVATRRGPAGPVSRAEFRVLGCEQVPGTNDYLFVIESKGKRLA